MTTATTTDDFAARMKAVVQRMRPCPFCGGKDCPPANVTVDDTSVSDFSEVFCPGCGARGPKADDWESAAEAWNSRLCTTVPAGLEVSERPEDMSPDGRLIIRRQRDGDMIVIVKPADDEMQTRLSPFGVSVEFCTHGGGGRSPRTLRALMDLMIAMEMDNQERPIR